MKKLFRIAQFGAIVCIMGLSIVLAILVLRQFLVPSVNGEPPTSPPPSTSSAASAVTKNSRASLLGKVLRLPNVDWATNKTTVVLYLSTSCHFCSESSPFYQRLAQEKLKLNFKLVAVLPQNEEAAKTYLESLDMETDRKGRYLQEAMRVTRDTPGRSRYNEG